MRYPWTDELWDEDNLLIRWLVEEQGISNFTNTSSSDNSTTTTATNTTIDTNVTGFMDDSATPAPNSCADFAGSRDLRNLRNTMKSYGTIFVVIMTVFCILRRRYPKVYNLRKTIPDIKTELAEESRGSISWMWKLFGIADVVMMDECGMDALCYTRVLEFGMKLAMIGILNSLWLIPVYVTAEQSNITKCISDWVVMSSMSNLPTGSQRYIAAVVGAYSIFGYTMYAILQEFVWFSRYRHLFLAKKLPRNYAVYVQCIPTEYQTNQRLLKFFQESSSSLSTNIPGTGRATATPIVLDAHLVVKAPNLQKKVALREKEVARLERAINIEEIRGQTPTSRRFLSLNSTSLTTELAAKVSVLNQEISQAIDTIQRKAEGIVETPVDTTLRSCEDDPMTSSTLLLPSIVEEGAATTSSLRASVASTGGGSSDGDSSRIVQRRTNKYGGTDGDPSTDNRRMGSSSRLGSASTFVTSGIKSSLHTARSAATSSAAGVARLILDRQEDGRPHSAGFVTFSSLRAAQAAKQIIQYAEPFAMEVLEAPQPEGTFTPVGWASLKPVLDQCMFVTHDDCLCLLVCFSIDVFWKNVGKTHQQLTLGKLFSFGLTAVLCLFWTVPMSFISSLSSIESLREQFTFIDKLITKLPGLEAVFAQLAPLLIIAANNVLKILLEMLSGLEGPISGAVVSAKLFTKLSSFMIIQTFFVTAISGSILDELSAMIKDSSLIVDLLARTLPQQSTFFIQILIVDTCIFTMGVELLRVVPLVMALLRRFLGPKLTQKERETTWMGLRPLNDPSEFSHAEVLASTVLYYTVFFVYATLAPITSWFMLVCFTFLSVAYRHQFVYIYPTFPDSGGKLWVAFFKLLPALMIMAQVTMLGVLALSKAVVASTMMFPLLITTVLFNIYINQQHFAMTEHLPIRDAQMADVRNQNDAQQGEEGESTDFDFLKDKYIQPELRDREVWPENFTVEREIETGCLAFSTPAASAAEDDMNPLMVRHDGSVKSLGSSRSRVYNPTN